MSTVNQVVITTPDGFPLAATVFEPSTLSKNLTRISVLISSATGAPRGYYDRFARFLMDQGVFVVTYDYRGMFASQKVPVKEEKARMRDWGEKDVVAILNWLHERIPINRIVALGHSIGGTLLGLASNNDLVSSAINIGTPTAYWRYWSGPRKYERMAEWYFFVPLLVNCLGYLPARFAGGALPKGVALEWARWGRHKQFVVDEQGRPIQDGFKRFERPMLFMSFTDDDFAPPTAVEAMKDLFTAATIEHKVIEPSDWRMKSIGHFGFFRKTAPIEVWYDTLKWIRASLLTTDQ